MKPLALLFLCVFVVWARDEAARRLPTDAPLNDYETLEMGVEHTIDVQSEDNDYYLIRMPTKNQPLHLYITPCNRPVHWNLRIPNNFALEPNVHPLSRHFNHVLHMRIPPLIEFTEDLHSREKLILLAGEENEKRMEFYANSVEADYVVLNMSSNRPTSVRVFATTLKSQLDAFYPQLPKDPSLTFSLNQSNLSNALLDLNLKWPVPEYLKDKGSNKYRFCVLISRHQPQYSICEQSTADLNSMHCTSSNTSEMLIQGLDHSERFYATVFIHNMLIGSNSAYFPVEFRTPTRQPNQTTPNALSRNQHQLENFQQLEDSILMKHHVNSRHGSSNNYIYRLPSNVADSKNIELIAHSCNGYIRLAIYKNGDLLRKTSDFVGLERFLINCQPGDQIRVQVINDDKVEVQYWIWASYQYDKSPFVDMPLDRSVRSVKRLCNKAILQFNRASNDENIRYCVHEKETRTDYFKDIINEPTQMCWADLPVGRQAICFRQNETEPLANLHYPLHDGQPMQCTIGGLKPSTTYRLDISAQTIDRKNAQPLAYRTLFIRTSDHC